MIESLFMITTNGEVLIEKHWRTITPRTVCDFFWDEVTKHDRYEDIPPLIEWQDTYLISIWRDSLFLLATCSQEVSPLLVVEFLHRVVDIFTAYFEVLDEAAIKDNFSTIYQLLEEMMDFGYPLTTEQNALESLIPPPSMLNYLTSVATGRSNLSEVLPDGTVSSMPWRKMGVKYAQNEIYLDIVEELDTIIDANGAIVSSEVGGVINANSRLSGIPDLLLTFTNPELIDDCSFHPCVRYTRFERERVVSFVPPDGQFELMRYQVEREGDIIGPLYCQPQFSFEYAASRGHLSLMVGVNGSSSLISSKPSGRGPQVDEVEAVIQFSRMIRTATFSPSVGTVLFDEATKVLRWRIGKMSRERTPQLTGSLVLQPGSVPEDTPAIELHWQVPMSTVSGIGVSSLQMTNENYRPYKGVRTMTKSGRCVFRS